MKKIFFVLFLTILVMPMVFSLDINVEKTSTDEVMILGLNEPVTFDLKITNNGAGEDLMFYTYFSPEVYPKGTTHIGTRDSINVQLKIYPPEKIKTGRYTFDAYIRGENGDEIAQNLLVNVIKFEDAFELGADEFDPQSSTISIYLYNKVNFNFENLNVKISSPFFALEKEFNLGPNQRQNFEINLNKEDFKKLQAGYYTMNAEIQLKDSKTEIEGTLKFVEKNILTTNKKTYGFIINTNIIEKVNEGNVVASSETVIKKNVLSRLFTQFSPEPNLVERQGFNVYYTWNNDIQPGEALTINVRTNWLLPFIMIILIVLVTIIVKKSSNRNILLDKQVSYVNVKGGEFALKVNIVVHAKNYLERVSVIDRLPYLTKIHEKFSGERPSRIDEKNKRIEWNFERMQKGERRMLSYMIYSKIGVLGKFGLPTATAVYEANGKLKESHSNQAFFMIEPRSRKDFEEA